MFLVSLALLLVVAGDKLVSGHLPGMDFQITDWQTQYQPSQTIVQTTTSFQPIPSSTQFQASFGFQGHGSQDNHGYNNNNNNNNMNNMNNYSNNQGLGVNFQQPSFEYNTANSQYNSPNVGASFNLQSNGASFNLMDSHNSFLRSSSMPNMSNQSQNQSQMQMQMQMQQPQRRQTFHLIDKTNENNIDGPNEQIIQQLRKVVGDLTKMNASGLVGEYVERLNEPGSSLLVRFLKQRGANIQEAAKLAVESIIWRQRLDLSNRTYNILCGMLQSGLIFEQKILMTRQEARRPVIWIRLGALSNAVKSRESIISPKKAIKANLRVVRKALKRGRDLTNEILSGERGDQRNYSSSLSQSSNDPISTLTSDWQSLANQSDFRTVLRTIAWWLDNWDRTHPWTRATLILDLENTYSALTSASISEFIFKLDDYFPDLFEKIVVYRYKVDLLSVKGQISTFNSYFIPQTLSKQTREKLVRVNNEVDLEPYISSDIIKGKINLPVHAQRNCSRQPAYPLPEQCQSPQPITATYNSNTQAISMISQMLMQC